MAFNTEIVTALLAGIGSSGILTYLVTRRKQAADEQMQIRKELREDMQVLREELNLWRERSLKLEDEVKQLLVNNQSLKEENQRLRERVSELEAELKRMHNKRANDSK